MLFTKILRTFYKGHQDAVTSEVSNRWKRLAWLVSTLETLPGVQSNQLYKLQKSISMLENLHISSSTSTLSSLFTIPNKMF